MLLVTFFSFLILNVYAKNPIIAEISPEQLKKIKSSSINIEYYPFTNFKKFPAFNNVYVIESYDKEIHQYIHKKFNSEKFVYQKEFFNKNKHTNSHIPGNYKAVVDEVQISLPSLATGTIQNSTKPSSSKSEDTYDINLENSDFSNFNISPTPRKQLSPIGQSIPDSYFNYQWYLETVDHKIETQKYGLGKFIKSEAIDKKASLQWSEVRNEFEKSFQRKARVAVLDSGIDIRHPDLAKHIYKNIDECRYIEALDLHLPEISFTEDKDNNGYGGDCAGWNFTSLKRPRRGEKLLGDNQVYDDSGHGTHVAGIMAAIENEIGIVGLSQNIEILPVKVLKQITSEREARRLSYEGLSHWVAQGILYAVEKQADVINLSLGWPEKVQNELVNKAIQTAHEAGVILVAGSGNDSHNASIYPCAHKYVICVGASDIHGEISNFSNYGPQVDVLAPGESILSLLPQKVDTLDYNNIYVFDDDKLSYMSGSSQSAPMISAVAAMLKTQDKNLLQIKRLLLSSSSKSTKTQSGLLSLKKLMCFLNTQNCPHNKRRLYIHSHSYVEDQTLYVNFENLSSDKQDFIIEILNSKNQVVSQNSFSLKGLEQKAVGFELPTPNLAAESTYQVRFYDHVIDIVAYTNSSSLPKAVAFKDVPEQIVSDWSGEYDTKNPSYLYNINSLDSKVTTNLFFTRKVDYETQSIHIHFFKKANTSVNYIGSYTVQGAQNLLSISMKDLDSDGIDDLFIRTLAQDNKLNRPFEKLTYLNSDLKVITEFSLYADQAIASTASDIEFYQYQDFKLPMLFKSGLVSKASISKTNYDHILEDTNVRTQRLYQFFPDSENPHKLVEHSFTNTAWMEEFSDQLFSKIFPGQMRPLFFQAELLLLLEKESDTLTFLTRLYNKKTEPHRVQYFFKTQIDLTTHQTRSEKLNIGSAQILGNKFVPMTSLQSKPHNNFTLSTINNKKREQLRLLHFIDNKWQQQNLIATELSDRFIAFHSSYYDQKYLYLHIETVNDLVFLQYDRANLDQPVASYKRAKIKSTFLPPFTFEEFYLPIFIKDQGKTVPALYNDQTQLFSGQIQVLAPKQNKLEASLELSYNITEDCHNMPLQFTGEHYQAIVFCPKQAVFKIQDLEIK